MPLDYWKTNAGNQSSIVSAVARSKGSELGCDIFRGKQVGAAASLKIHAVDLTETACTRQTDESGRPRFTGWSVPWESHGGGPHWVAARLTKETPTEMS